MVRPSYYLGAYNFTVGYAGHTYLFPGELLTGFNHMRYTRCAVRHGHSDDLSILEL